MQKIRKTPPRHWAGHFIDQLYAMCIPLFIADVLMRYELTLAEAMNKAYKDQMHHYAVIGFMYALS